MRGHFLITSLSYRHDISAAFKKGNKVKLKDYKELLCTGIVTEECFKVLCKEQNSHGKFKMNDIWNFLIHFKLATVIQVPKSLYIPALIPDIKETHLKARITEINKSPSTLGFYYSFEKSDQVFGLFSHLLGQLASTKHFYKMEQPGIYLQEGFSAKIESRKLGVVAAMAGFLTWTDQDQTDEVQFVVAERDCNHFDTNQRFGRHKVFFLVLFFFGKKSFCSFRDNSRHFLFRA